MQEASTGKKRVDKLDWMYAAPSQEGGALGGARIGDREMEEYLLGKRRVDEVLAQGDKNVSGNSLLAMFVGLLLVLVWSGMAKKEEAGFLVRVKTASGTGTSGEVRGGRDTLDDFWPQLLVGRLLAHWSSVASDPIVNGCARPWREEDKPFTSRRIVLNHR
jgi:hypothetical protein